MSLTPNLSTWTFGIRRTSAFNRRSGFTLLEVILAVALTAIVVGIIAGAIDFHLRQLTVRRTHIEEAQLARAVLRQIANDLRAVVVYRPPDFSNVEALADLADSASATLTDATETETESTEPDTSAAEDLASSVVPPSMPGIYGNQYELQVDVSRIPRYEEYELAIESGTQMGGLSDLKTVTYFLTSSAQSLSATTINAIGTAEGATSGLVRRVVGRATARYTLAGGNFESLDQASQLIAPEVVDMQFSYFDGYQWNTEWDSDVRDGIPLAVEIMIQINDFRLDDPSDRDKQRTGTQQASTSQQNVYRLVVYLPGAEPLDPSQTSDSTTGETGSETEDTSL